MLKSVNCCDHVCILLLGLAALASHPLVGFMDFSFLCKRDIALSSRTALVVLSVTYCQKTLHTAQHCIQNQTYQDQFLFVVPVLFRD